MADSERTEKTYRAMIGRMMDRLWRESESAGDTAGVVDILAMSGGGDYGAFGAGFLVGWGSATDEAVRRPDFDAVTGVSTGALLAPFAYVGTDESCTSVEAFYRNPKNDWMQERGPLFFLPSNGSFMTIPGLERDIRVAIDKQRVEQMAEQSRAGKLLIISATDLDLGRQRYWDVGLEAEAAVASGDLDRVQRIMLASSAIPVAFPAVQIDDSLYADGGVTANVFLSLDPRTPDGLIARWKIAHPGKPFPRFRYWVIINNQLAQQPKTVQTKWPSIASASLSTSIRSATLAEVRWLAAQADFINASHYADVEVRVVAIPDDWRAPVEGTFKKETMESLSELGRRMGADPGSWRLWASPQTSVLGRAPEVDAPTHSRAATGTQE